MSIPSNYQSLPGFKTVYSETELRSAIAIAESLIVNGLASPPSSATVQYITGIASSAGDNQIIAAPGAGVRIYIIDLLIQNESAVATTILLKDSTNKLRIFAQNQGDGLSRVYPIGRELKLSINQALILNLSGANSIGYSIGYYVGI